MSFPYCGPLLALSRHLRRLTPVYLALAAVPLTPALADPPPTTGTILQQTTPAPAMPEAPGSVLTLPTPKVQRSRSSIRIPVSRIRIEGNTLLPKGTFVGMVGPLIGRTVTLGRLDALAERVTERYHAAGYPLAYAYVPAQTIRGGVVVLKVIEPRYDAIRLKGHTRLRAAMVRSTLGRAVAPEQPIASAPLSRGLLLLSRTPGVRVAGTLVPGAAPATSALDVQLADEPRVRIGVGADNYGGAYTGRAQGSLDLSLSDPFGYGSQLAVNGLDSESGLLQAGGFNLLSPNLYRGLRVSLYGSRTAYRLGGVYQALEQSGRADQFGAGVSYPLVLRPGRLLQLRLDVLRDDLTQSTASVGVQNRSSVSLQRLSLSGAYADAWGGVNSAGLSVAHGQLALDSGVALQADASGPQTAGNFWVGQLNLGRRQRLAYGLGLDAQLSGQLASRNLDGSQQFYLGGPSGVMSYPVGEAGGAEGVLLRLRLGRGVPLGRLPGQLRAFVLAQAGKVWVARFAYAGAANAAQYRAGAGVGLDYHWRSAVSSSLSYVHRVGPAKATAGPDHGGELWASLNVSLG